ncbi:MAG: DUF167 domain-containing protein [Solirubrobacteraceae bacterium]|jgi:uncharacterized protein (TIGR00251 family)
MDAQIEVALQPRARRDEIIGLREGVVVARVCAPPVDGEANHALCRLIARRAGLAPTRVRVVSGMHARRKLIRVADIDRIALIAALDLSEL